MKIPFCSLLRSYLFLSLTNENYFSYFTSEERLHGRPSVKLSLNLLSRRDVMRHPADFCNGDPGDKEEWELDEISQNTRFQYFGSTVSSHGTTRKLCPLVRCSLALKPSTRQGS